MIMLRINQYTATKIIDKYNSINFGGQNYGSATNAELQAWLDACEVCESALIVAESLGTTADIILSSELVKRLAGYV